MPNERYTAFWILLSTGAVFGYAPAAGLWIYLDSLLYGDGLSVGGFLSSLFVSLTISRIGNYQYVLCLNFLFVLLWMLAIFSGYPPIEIFHGFALGILGGISSGLAFAALPVVFSKSLSSGRNLFFNSISPLCFASGVCLIYSSVHSSIVCRLMLISLGIFFLQWVAFLCWTRYTQTIRIPEVSKSTGLINFESSMLCKVEPQFKPTLETMTPGPAVKMCNGEPKPLSNTWLLALLGLQPLSVTLFLPLFQLICMNIADNPWVCYRNYIALQLFSIPIGSWFLQKYPRFSLLPASSLALASLYYALSIFCDSARKRDTARCTELPVDFVMVLIAFASSLGWYQLPFLVLFELCRQDTAANRTGLFMTVWWLSAYMVSFAFRWMSNEIELSVILIGFSLLFIFLATVTSYLPAEASERSG